MHELNVQIMHLTLSLLSLSLPAGDRKQCLHAGLLNASI